MQSQAHSLQDSPISMATAPQPPEGLAGPRAYTARSEATTKAYLPSQDFDSIQFTAFRRAAVAPKQALMQSTPCTDPLLLQRTRKLLAIRSSEYPHLAWGVLRQSITPVANA